MTPPRGFMQFESTQTQMRLPRDRCGRHGAPLRPLDVQVLRDWHPAHGLHRLLFEDAGDALHLYEQCERRNHVDLQSPRAH